MDIYKDVIEHWIINDGLRIPEVLASLFNEYNCKVSRSSLCSRMREWGITIRPRLKNKDAIAAKISNVFHEERSTDAETQKLLADQGHQISQRSIRHLRQQIGLYKHSRPEDDERTEAVLKEVMEAEQLDSFTRNKLHVRMRREYGLVARDKIYAVAQRLLRDHAVHGPEPPQSPNPPAVAAQNESENTLVLVHDRGTQG